jgi:hypothetical protein
MRDAPSERGLAGEFLVGVQLHKIAGQAGEIHDIGFRHRAPARFMHVAYGEVFVIMAHDGSRLPLYAKRLEMIPKRGADVTRGGGYP